MQVLEAVRLWAEYQKSHSKQNTIRTYKLVLFKLCEEVGAMDVEAMKWIDNLYA